MPSSRASIETHSAYYAACLSVTLAVVALLPSLPLRVVGIFAGLGLAVARAPVYLRRATPFTAALVTVAAASISTATVIWLSGLPWKTGISWSQAGGIGQSTAWLFTTTSLCFGTGILAAGRLVLRQAYAGDAFARGGYRLASTLPVISFLGFLVLALCPVGGIPALGVAHNIASWAAVGSFWLGMVASLWVRELTRALRFYSVVAIVLVFGTWLPNGLRFMGLIEARPVSMLAMELVVFPLCCLWFCWLAWEWSPQASQGTLG